MTTLKPDKINIIENDNAKIKVLGVGGGGSNAVSRMFKDKIPKVEYLIFNTDSQALEQSDVSTIVKIGDQTARGLGVGGDPERGRECAEESKSLIRELVDNSDLVFVAAGMGGGTGTGASPVIAGISRECGALTIGVVTKPFGFEGVRRRRQAQEGIEKLKNCVDTLIVIPNDRLLMMADNGMTMESGFRMADDVLRQGVQSIAELILVPGEINLDFADVKTIMKKAGPAWMAIGKGSGEDRAIKAAKNAIESPLLEMSIEGAKGVIFNVTGGTDLKVSEVQQASEIIAREAHPDANIIFGMVTDPKMENEIKLTVIATGFPDMEISFEDQDKIEKTLKETIEDDTALDLPPFLRNYPNRIENKK